MFTWKDLVLVLLNKIKQPHFVVGILASLFLASGVAWESITDWHTFFELIWQAVQNPAILIAIGIDVWATMKNDK